MRYEEIVEKQQEQTFKFSKKRVHKIVNTIRAFMEVYYAFKSKNIFHSTMALSSLSNLLENVEETEQESEYIKNLIKDGYKEIFTNVRNFNLLFLNLIDVVGVNLLDKIYLEDKTEVYKYNIFDEIFYCIGNGNSKSSMKIFYKDENQLCELLKKFINKNCNFNIFLRSDPQNYIVEVDKVFDLNEAYVPLLKEDEYYETIMKFRDINIYRSSILFGPPGVGKTTFAVKMAKKFNGKALIIDSLALKFICDFSIPIEKIINIISPSVLLLDDIDRVPENFIESLLGLIDKINNSKNYLILATVNNLDRLPVPLKRPGRFDEIIVFDCPNREQRKNIIEKYLHHYNFKLDSSKIEKIVDETEELTAAYLKEIVLQSTVLPMERLLLLIKHIKYLKGN